MEEAGTDGERLATDRSAVAGSRRETRLHPGGALVYAVCSTGSTRNDGSGRWLFRWARTSTRGLIPAAYAGLLTENGDVLIPPRNPQSRRVLRRARWSDAREPLRGASNRRVRAFIERSFARDVSQRFGAGADRTPQARLDDGGANARRGRSYDGARIVHRVRRSGRF